VELESVNYEAVIEDLKARKAKSIADFDGAIATIEMLVLGKALTGNGATFEPSPDGLTNKIKDDTFFNLSAPEASKKYLEMMKRTASTTEILEAIKRGGFQSLSKNLYSNLYTSLMRSPEFRNVGGGKWGLSSWYPGSPKKQGKKGTAKAEVEEDEPLMPIVPDPNGPEQP